MLSRVFYVGLISLHFFWTSEAKLNYAVMIPSEITNHSPELACLHIEGAKGETSVQLTLNTINGSTTLVERKFTQESVFSCVPFQVLNPPTDNEEVGTVNISIRSLEVNIDKITKVLLKRKQSKILVQTDKPVYKPGQNVKFRIVSLYENLLPRKQQIPVIEVKDPAKNRIGQWLNVNLNQGIAEFSFPLSKEPTLGEYSITIQDTVHTFSVEEYVLPKYEVTLQFPQLVMFNSEVFTVKICGRYTHGKPVQGMYNGTMCRTGSRSRWRSRRTKVCTDIAGKLDRSGCSTTEIKSHLLNLNQSGFQMTLEGEASITEDGTGVQLSTSSQTTISEIMEKVLFVDIDEYYHTGIPYTGKLKVENAIGDPVPGKVVHLTYSKTEIKDTYNLVTDSNGHASFVLENTTFWDGDITLEAKTNEKSPTHTYGFIQYKKAEIQISPFYSKSKSYLKLHSVENVLPCEGRQDVRVDYIIKRTELNPETEHLDLRFLVTSKGSVLSSGETRIPLNSVDRDLSGTTKFTFPLSVESSPILKVLVYVFLPQGEIVADLAKFKVQRCFKNKVSVGFSPVEVLPGSDVSLQIQADPGSLCGLRVVDQSVVLIKPEKELTADKVHSLFPSSNNDGYSNKILDDDNAECDFRSLKRNNDVYSLFKNMKIRMITSADINRPCDTYKSHYGIRQFGWPVAVQKTSISSYKVRNSPHRYKEDPTPKNNIPGVPQNNMKKVEIIRTYFPETWLWELKVVRDSGSVELHKTAPDTITDWKAGALCMGPSGFGLSSPVSLRVFQPFFVDLTLPYSMIRGESFTLKATVFNYLKDCIMVQTTLGPSEELEEEPCADCPHTSCLCADESKTFYWNLKATKLGEVNITIRTEALDTQDLCHNELPVVPKQGSIDTMVKPLLVQPGGVLEEKSHSTLICVQEGEDRSKSEEISLRIPENILADSERAQVTVLGDLMGTAMQNLDKLLAMPYGCGEQNMVLFAPNIFILQYLAKTHQLNDEILRKAKMFLQSGYQRQLTYKHDDGAYSAFGKSDKEGNTWLTAFVVKSFNKASPYIFIDGNHLTHSFNWLRKHRKENNCFENVGKLFNNAMKGGVEDELSLSAYVTIALLESNVSPEDPLVGDALSCLRKAALDVSNVYTQALLAYMFTLAGETGIRQSLLEKLEKRAVRNDGELHWERTSTKPTSERQPWYRAPSAEVELTAYMLMTELSGPEKDLGRASEMANWLSKQQNPYGGFSSTQDTVVALQALAQYAEATFSDTVNVTVTVRSQTGVQEFHVDNTNRLLLQTKPLHDIPGDYTLTATGSGCVYIQTVLRYNVPPPRSEATFSVRVEVKPDQCSGDSVTKLQINIYTEYTGSREKSNMAIIEVKMLSGFIPIKSSVRELETNKVIQRSDISADMVTLYLNQLEHKSLHLSFVLEQDIKVKNLKPATVKVYDYYETEEYVIGEYNSPCSSDEKTTNSR